MQNFVVFTRRRKKRSLASALPHYAGIARATGNGEAVINDAERYYCKGPARRQQADSVATNNRLLNVMPHAGKCRRCELGQREKQTQPIVMLAADWARSPYHDQRASFVANFDRYVDPSSQRPDSRDCPAPDLLAQSLVMKPPYGHTGEASGVLSPSK